MWEFDYQRAWYGLAAPKLLALPPDLLEVVRTVVIATQTMRQNSALGMDWPTEIDLKKILGAHSAEALHRASEIVYQYGHWNPRGTVPAYEAWIPPAYAVDNEGGYWKFQKYVRHYLIEIGYRPNSWELPEFSDTALKPVFFTHKEGTELDWEELAAKYAALIPENSGLKVVSVRPVKYYVPGYEGHPHLFTIGPGHMKSDSIYLDPTSHGCYYKENEFGLCGLDYADHTYDLGLWLTLTRSMPGSEFANIVFPIKQELIKDKIKGIALKKSGFKLENTHANGDKQGVAKVEKPA